MTVPSLVGKYNDEALAAIAAAGLIQGDIIENYTYTMDADRVVGQYPLAGNSVPEGSSVKLFVSLGYSTEIPPEPSSVAPDVDTTAATNMASASEFLYTGNNPIQKGVCPGVITPRQVAVIKGRVLTRAGAGLEGVTISILHHTDFGGTLSRADGRFDMAVNGGGLLTVCYQKAGYLPAQRQLYVPWQGYTTLPDVVMIALDTDNATQVDFPVAGSMEAIHGRVENDTFGQRQVMILFPQGTTASLVMPDDSLQPAATLNISATEYTVGESGPSAMPAELPPTSFYTYAVEFSAEEAVAAGAKGVRFSQTVYAYLENFLNFTVGTHIPSGYYDYEKGVWIPEQDGRVVKIVNITGELADLDTNGEDLGITDAEREALADYYAAGTSLWRMPVNHFTPRDWNFPVVTQQAAEHPTPQPVQPQNVVIQHPNTNNHYGSIDFQNRVFREQAPVTGTPFSLHYVSNRVPGYLGNTTVRIPLSGTTVPASLKGIELRVEVGGKVFSESFAPAINLTHTFAWDRKDVYGRTLQGAQPIAIKIGYVYDGYYAVPPDAAASFGLASGTAIDGLYPARRDITLWQEQHISVGASGAGLGGWDARAMGFGGWTLNVHHAYDLGSHTL